MWQRTLCVYRLYVFRTLRTEKTIGQKIRENTAVVFFLNSQLNNESNHNNGFYSGLKYLARNVTFINPNINMSVCIFYFSNLK